LSAAAHSCLGDKRLPVAVLRQHHAVAVKNGFAGVNVNYRLAPAGDVAAGAEDVAGVVQWVSDNIAARVAMLPGIYLLGHSAGACMSQATCRIREFHKMKAAVWLRDDGSGFTI